MNPIDLLTQLMLQAQIQMNFGGNDSPDFQVLPGAASTALYDSNSDLDPMGQSYYDQGDQGKGKFSMSVGSDPSIISKIIQKFRGPQNQGALSLY